jgi:Cdc6-like AAA superfamily ATPase
MPTLDEYLEEKSNTLSGGNIKNGEVFDMNYLPPKIYERKELFTMADIVLDYLKRDLRLHIVVSGPRGYGKTVCTRYLLSSLEEKAKEKKEDTVFFYVPCREKFSEYAILKFMMNAEEGITKSSLLSQAKEFFKGKKGIVVLDEADRLRDLDILYFLSRDTRLQTICIVRGGKWVTHLEDSVRSSFQRKSIIFGKYTTNELSIILKQRAELGLYYYDERAIDTLAGIVLASYNGDVRFAIAALGQLGKRNEWDEKAIKESLAEGIKEIEASIVSTLSDTALIVLRELIEHPDGIDTSSLFQKVKGIIKSKSTFFSALEDLQRDELIALFGGRRGKSYFVAPVIHNPSAVKEEYESRAAWLVKYQDKSEEERSHSP